MRDDQTMTLRRDMGWRRTRCVALPALGVVLGATCGAYGQAKLLPPDGQTTSAYFGDAGALDGNTAIIGASNATASQAAYMYENIGGTWTRTATLTDAFDTDTEFGWAVDVSGDHAAVGAYRTGAATQDGAVNLYGRNQGGAGTWGENTVLTPSNLVGSQQYWFGYSLGLDGNTLVVGAPRTDQVGTDDGTAYIFEYNAGAWSETKILNTTGHHQGEQLGSSSAISGDHVIVGAPRAVHLPGGGSDGAAYIYSRNAGGDGNWGEVQKLTASDHQPGDLFGSSVAISGNTAVVGSPWTDEVPGTNSRSGSVYIFDFDGDSWTETAQVHASDAQSQVEYALNPNSVAIHGDLLVVGAMRHVPMDGTADDGTVYVYSRHAGGTDNWGQVAMLTGELDARDHFGSVVDIDGVNYLIGARFDDDGGNNVGAAYIIPIPEPATAGLMLAAGAFALARRRVHG